MALSDLAPELVQSITSHLTIQDIFNLAATCRYLHSCTDDPVIWKLQIDRVLQVFGVTVAPGDDHHLDLSIHNVDWRYNSLFLSSHLHVLGWNICAGIGTVKRLVLIGVRWRLSREAPHVPELAIEAHQLICFNQYSHPERISHQLTRCFPLPTVNIRPDPYQDQLPTNSLLNANGRTFAPWPMDTSPYRRAWNDRLNPGYQFIHMFSITPTSNLIPPFHRPGKSSRLKFKQRMYMKEFQEPFIPEHPKPYKHWPTNDLIDSGVMKLPVVMDGIRAGVTGFSLQSYRKPSPSNSLSPPTASTSSWKSPSAPMQILFQGSSVDPTIARSRAFRVRLLNEEEHILTAGFLFEADKGDIMQEKFYPLIPPSMTLNHFLVNSPPVPSGPYCVKDLQGWWVGTYSAQGSQVGVIFVHPKPRSTIVQLVYVKMTGDHNVPSGVVSWCINLDTHGRGLDQIFVPTISAQDFFNHQNAPPLDVDYYPNPRKRELKGFGRMAFPGYNNPTNLPVRALFISSTVGVSDPNGEERLHTVVDEIRIFWTLMDEISVIKRMRL